jgi:hypothetical protein
MVHWWIPTRAIFDCQDLCRKTIPVRIPVRYPRKIIKNETRHFEKPCTYPTLCTQATNNGSTPQEFSIFKTKGFLFSWSVPFLLEACNGYTYTKGGGRKCIGNFLLLQLAGQVTAVPPPFPPPSQPTCTGTKKFSTSV